MERDLRQSPLYREIEDLFRRSLEPSFGLITAPDDPQPSPDGRWIAFRGEVRDGLEGHPQGRVCLAAADGSGVRRLTHGPHDDGQPRWSPDGRTLSFRSDRQATGRHRLYALDALELGEARALVELPGTAELHEWSPDGSRILVIVAGMEAEQSDAVGSGTVGEDADLPPWVPEVESSERGDESRRRLFTIDVAGDVAASACREDLNVWEAGWCGPDRIAAISSDGYDESAWYRARVAMIDRATGEDRTILTSDVQLGWITPSPGGGRIAVVEALCSDRLVVAGNLVLLDPSGADVRRADTAGVDVAGLAWVDDEHLLAIGIRGLETVVLDVDARTGAVEERWRTPEASGGFRFPLASVAQAFVTLVQSWRRPPQLVSVQDGTVSPLTEEAHAGTEVLSAAVDDRRSLRWTAPDGLEIDGLITLPHGDGPFPLILDVHGGPIWAYQDVWLDREVAALVGRGYAILQANPRGSWGRGPAFAELVVGDMGGADALDLLAGVDHVIAMGVADPDRIGIIGGSYGGFMACWLPTQDPRFKAAVAISPVTDWYSERFESNLGRWSTDFLGGGPRERQAHYHERSPVLTTTAATPTLLTAGRRDRATPTGQAVEFHRVLRERGVPTDVALYPQEGHGVRDLPAGIDLLTRIVGWFERHMPAGPTTG